MNGQLVQVWRPSNSSLELIALVATLRQEVVDLRAEVERLKRENLEFRRQAGERGTVNHVAAAVAEQPRLEVKVFQGCALGVGAGIAQEVSLEGRFALHTAGGLRTDHPAYRDGLALLVKSQEPDGSWLVRSRSNPFQPYYESGFPHGKNQFISVAASGWATTALVLACGTK